jgi:hypothetical protein
LPELHEARKQTGMVATTSEAIRLRIHAGQDRVGIVHPAEVILDVLELWIDLRHEPLAKDRPEKLKAVAEALEEQAELVELLELDEVFGRGLPDLRDGGRQRGESGVVQRGGTRGRRDGGDHLAPAVFDSGSGDAAAQAREPSLGADAGAFDSRQKKLNDDDLRGRGTLGDLLEHLGVNVAVAHSAGLAAEPPEPGAEFVEGTPAPGALLNPGAEDPQSGIGTPGGNAEVSDPPGAQRAGSGQI